MKGDFIGFSFCGVNSSDLGILRVSDGSRYNEYLLPNSQDNTIQIPGGDGTYYFGTYYTNRPIPIQIAFDDLNALIAALALSIIFLSFGLDSSSNVSFVLSNLIAYIVLMPI